MKYDHPRLSQEAMPERDWPYRPDWIVTRVSLSPHGWASAYPVVVTGRNLSEGGRLFVWQLPLPLSWRYDLRAAEYGEGVLS